MSKIFAISDLHTDYEANMDFVENLPGRPQDVLIVAGDVSDNISRYCTAELQSCKAAALLLGTHTSITSLIFSRLIETLSLLKSKYKEVYFIPGNHELWINKSDISPNSLVKLFEIVKRCETIGTLLYLLKTVN